MRSKKVFIIKVVHSFIFLFMVACLVYILYCAIAGRYDWTLLLALVAIASDGLALLLNRGKCPFTTLTEKLGAKKGLITDIFLPDWCARHAFKISVVIVTIEVIWLAWGYFG
jgi:hypothetical protein